MNARKQGSWWRVTVLLTVVSMILAACAGGGGGASSAPASSAAASTAPASSAAASSSAESSEAASPSGSGAAPAGSTAAGGGGFALNPEVSGTVEFWHFWSSPQRANAIDRVIGICQQKLPNIQVTDTFKPFNDIWTANIAAVSAGSGMPDVIVEDRVQLPARAQQNIASSLQEYATRDGVDGSQFWDFTWDQTLYNGETYGLPFETDVYVLYYNKNAFREAGLDPNTPPTTWAEAEEMGAKLDKKAEDGSLERVGFYPIQGAGGNIWGYANGVEWVQDGKPVVNGEQAVETYEFLKRGVDRYGGWENIENFRAGFAAPPNDAFMSGKMAMVVNTAGYQQTLNFFRPQVQNAEGENEPLEWGVALLPHNADAEPGTWSGGFALSIPRGADNAEAAWEFMKCAAGPDGATSWSRDTYAIPAYQPAMDDPALTADPAWSVFTEAMSTTNSDVFVPEYPTYFQQVNLREEEIWTGALTPEEGLNQAQQAIEQEIGGQ